MAEDVYMQFINGAVTESAAGTLTELEVLTGASVAGMVKEEAISLELREIITKFAPTQPEDNPSAGATEWQVFALSVESGLTSLPEIDAVHCIYYHQTTLRAGVATYLPLVEMSNGYPRVWRWHDPLLIPHPKIYAYVQSSNSSDTQEVKFRLGFTYVMLSGAEVMEALEVWRSPTA